MIGVTTRGIQYDDAFSILLSGRPLGEIIQGTAADTMPPLYYLLLHFWQFLGTSIAFQRLPGILLSLGIIALTYDMVSRLEGESAAIWTGAILAVSPLQYYHAQDIRMYSLATFFILGWNWMAVQIIQSEKAHWWKWIVLVICGAGALYSHALAGFGLLIPFIYLFIKKNWKRLTSLIAAGIVSLMVFLPWLVYIPGQIAKVQQAFWTPVPGVVEILQSIAMILGDIPVPAWVLGVILFSSIAVAVICIMVFWRSRQNHNSVLYIFLMVIIPPLILLLLSYTMRPVFVPRGFLSAYVAAAALIGMAASRGKGIEKALIAGFVVLSAVCTLPYQINFNGFPRSPFLQASIYLHSEVKDRDIVLHDNKLSFFPFEVYAPDLNSRFLADQPGSPNDTLAQQTRDALGLHPYSDPSTAVQGYPRVFFVVFQQTVTEYETGGGHPVMESLGKLAGKPIVHPFGDLLILEYSFLGGQP